MEHLVLAGILFTGLVSPPPPSVSLQACPVTTSNQAKPPADVLAKAGMPAGSAFHGNGQVWTSLWPDGNVVFRKGGPGEIMPDGSLRMKFLWLLAGDGPLTIEGRRLDGAARPLGSIIIEGFVGRGFQPSSLLFPTTGCWEVTARANGSTLTFVTRVTAVGY